MLIELDLVQTLAAATVVLFLGYGVKRRVLALRRYSIPEPVVGGVLFAGLVALLQGGSSVRFQFDTTLQTPLMLAFFTTVGLGARVALLRRGGPRILLYLGASTILAVLQNLLGVAIAWIADVHPGIGLTAASVTMIGGHGTGATFASVFAGRFNLHAALELSMAAATFGLVAGGLLGGPLAEHLIERRRLKSQAPDGIGRLDVEEDNEIDLTPNLLLETLLVVTVAMGFGQMLQRWGAARGMQVPAFVWCLGTAILLLNLVEGTGRYALKPKAVDTIGTVSLSLFLAMALMTLRLSELVNLALPLLAILVAQAALTVLFACYVTFRLMGSDFEAALMAAGQVGFGLGSTSTAVATMETLVSRHGPAPVAFFVVPLVGGFLIDVVNVAVIQGFLSLVGG